MGLQWAGVDLSGVIATVCRHFKIEEKELVSAAKGLKAAHARAVISHIASRDLSISGSEVARRLHVDRSAVSRAVQRVENNPDSLGTARTIRGVLGLPKAKQVNIETTSPSTPINPAVLLKSALIKFVRIRYSFSDNFHVEVATRVQRRSLLRSHCRLG